MKMEGAFRSSLLRIIFPHIPCSNKYQNLSTINTVAHASRATVSRLFSLYAAISATRKPAAPEMMLSVAFRMAGKVMAARQAYGT
mgnify:CR=1 FL=1